MKTDFLNILAKYKTTPTISTYENTSILSGQCMKYCRRTEILLIFKLLKVSFK